MDKLGKQLGNIVRKNSGFGVTWNIPAPPVLSPTVRSGGSSIGSALARQVPTQTRQSAFNAPPPPTLSIGDAIGRSTAQSFEMPRALMPQPSTSGSAIMRMPTVFSSDTQGQGDLVRSGNDAWGVYDVNGVNVAMPSWLADHNNFELTEGASLITDPQGIENMRGNHISYRNMPEEVTRNIKMPEEITAGSQIGRLAQMANRDLENASAKERADGMAAVAEAAITGGLNNATGPTLEARQWNEEHEYTLINNSSTGTTELVRSSELENWDDDSYEVITNRVSASEAESIWNSGVLDGTAAPQTDIDTEQYEQGLQRELYDMSVRNRAALAAAISQDGVVEIDGKHYPEGVDGPIPTVTTTGWDFNAEATTVREDLPDAPDGWIWVQDDDEAWIVPEQYDIGDRLVTPVGTRVVLTRDEARDNMFNSVADWGSETFISGLETVINFAVDKSPSVVPTWVKNLWDKHVQDPASQWIEENVPDGRIKTAMLEALENPIMGAVIFASVPGDGNIDLITQASLYPGESKLSGIAGVQRNVPVVDQYVEFIESNPDQARDYYENGYDSDGDGQVDITGSDAVMQWWYDEELVDSPGGSATWLTFLMITDPLTWAAGTGVVGRGVRSSGRSMRMRPDAGGVARLAGRTIERTGQAIEVGSRIAEDVGDLGLRYQLQGASWLFQKSPLGRATSTARGTLHLREVEAATSETANSTGRRMGSLEVDRQTGDIILVPDDANAPTTGPAARQAADTTTPVDYEVLDAQHAEAFGIEVGQTVNLGRGQRATRTNDGWEVTTADGETATGTTQAAAVEEAGNTTSSAGVPERYTRRQPEPGREPTYIDQMNTRLYDQVIEDVGVDNLIDSVAIHRASDTPNSDVPNIQHLNETDRMGWVIQESAASIDPTFSARWQRNINGGDTTYQLSEAFRRADADTALEYWSAMTGGGNAVPTVNGTPFQSSAPLMRLRTPNRGSGRGSRQVRMANNAVDNVYARLKYNPGDVYDPRFAEMIRQAVVTDAGLRARGLRYSGPDWTYDPIVSLIPDDAPIRLKPEHRAMADYDAPQMRVDATDAEFIMRVAMDDQTGLGVDVYRITDDQLPDAWRNYWTEIDPASAGQQYWAMGEVSTGQGDTAFTVYGRHADDVVNMAEETAMSRGLVDAETLSAGWDVERNGPYPRQAVDHVQSIDPEAVPQEAVGSTQSDVVPEVDAILTPDTTSAPVDPDASFRARLRQMLDEAEGVEPEGTIPTESVTSTPTRTVAEVFEAEQSRATQRAETTARTSGNDPMPGARLPEATGETVMDPTGTIEMPVRRAVDVEATPEVTGTAPGQKILDDVLGLPGDSPRLRTLEAQAGKPTAATHLLERDYSSGTSTSDNYWLGRTVEKWQNDVLTEHPFPDGETYKDRVTRYFVEEGNKSGWTGLPDTHMKAAITRAFKEYEAHIWENVYQRGVFSNETKARIKTLPEPMQKTLSILAAVARFPLRAFDRYSQWIRQRILFHPLKVLHYPMVQYVGNHMLNVLAGDWKVVRYMSSPANVARAYRRVKAGDTAGWLADGGPMTGSQRMNARLGLESAPQTQDVLRGRAIGREGDHMMGGKFLTERLGRTGEAASFFVAGSKFARDFGAAMDVVYREAIEVSSMHHHVKRTMPDYRNAQINRMVEDWGMDMDDARTMWKGFEDSIGSRWEFSPDDVRSYFAREFQAEGRMRATEARGRAERMARDWRQTLREGQNYSRDQIKRRAMAQDQTRADVVAQRLMAFHFFQSRQMWFMVNQMANHPFLINLYINATEELEAIAERNGYPEYLQGWLKILTGPGGRQLFMNPFALLATYGLFEENNTFRTDQDGENRNIIERWIKDNTGIDFDLRMFGVNPSLDNLMNLGGFSGDTWAPDLTGYGRDANILTLIVNTGRAYGLWGDDPMPKGNWLDDKARDLREWVSGINPWADEVESRSSEQSMDREIRAIMSDELAKEGIDPESDEGQLILAEAEMDPDSDLYQRSLKRWIHGEWYEVGTRAVVGPFRPRFRLGDRNDEDLMYNLGENTKRLVNTPEPMVTLFKQQASGYYEAGDTRGVRILNLWDSIAQGELKGDITVNGITYTEAEVKAMDYEQRAALANGMMAEYGLLGDVNAVRDERKKYLAQPENRDFAQYRQWNDAVRNYPGGPEQYWKDLIKDNPSAKVYYDTWLSEIDDPDERARAMMGHNAYFSILGWDTYVFDKPIESYGSRNEIWDPVGVANTQPQPVPYEEHDPSGYRADVREIPVLTHDLQAYDRHVQEKMQQRGYPPGTSFKNLSRKERTAIEDELSSEGIYEPKPSKAQEDYLTWVAEQPPGRLAGLSEQQIIELFLEENQQDYYDSLPAQTDDIINEPKPIPGPDRYGTTPSYDEGGTFWQDLFNLLNEHDHNRYNDPWP